MDVQIERSSETLDQCDGPRLEGSAKSLALCFLSEIGRDRPVNNRKAMSLHAGILGEDKPQGHRKAQDPLSDTHSGENVVHEVRGRFRHPSPAAGGTEPAFLARKGEQFLAITILTAKPEESVRQNPTA